MVVSLGDLWSRFDAFGRKFINNASPILGSAKMEREFLERAQREQAKRDKANNA